MTESLLKDVEDFNPLERSRQDVAGANGHSADYPLARNGNGYIVEYRPTKNDFQAAKDDPQTAEEVKIYLDNRPYLDNRRKVIDPATDLPPPEAAGDYFENQRNIYYQSTQDTNYEDMDLPEITARLTDANSDRNFTALKNILDYRPQKIKATVENAGILALANMLASPETKEDKLAHRIITDTLLDKMIDYSEKLNQDGFAEGQAEDAILDSVMGYIEKTEKESVKTKNAPYHPVPAISEGKQAKAARQSESLVSQQGHPTNGANAKTRAGHSERRREIFNEYGIGKDELHVFDYVSEITKKIIVIDAYDKGEDDRIFELEYPTDQEEEEPGRQTVDSWKFLKLLFEPDNMKEAAKLHANEEGGAQIRNTLRDKSRMKQVREIGMDLEKRQEASLAQYESKLGNRIKKYIRDTIRSWRDQI